MADNILDCSNCTVYGFDQFMQIDADVVINCVGVSYGQVEAYDIFQVTENFDELVINKLLQNKNVKYINFSSGAVYGDNFETPATQYTQAQLPVNTLGLTNYYGLAKLYSEAKHRALSDLFIVDLRVFGFISQFIDFQRPYLFTDIINAVKNKQVLLTDDVNIVRDYIHPQDLVNIIKLLIQADYKLNQSYDVYSKAPISKNELLHYFKNNYALQVQLTEKIKLSPTGLKLNYYSEYNGLAAAGYVPNFSSLESIKYAIQGVLK